MRTTALALLGGFLLPLLLSLQPGVLLGTHLLGTGTPDLWGHSVQYDLVARSLTGEVVLDRVPTRFPEGQALWQADPVVPYLLAPVTWLVGAGGATMANLLLHTALLAGALTWSLRRWGVQERVALGAGLLAVAHPFTRGVVTSSLPEVLALAWLPLFAVLLEEGLLGRSRSLVAALAVGVCMVLDGLYAALPGALVGAVVLGAALLRERRAAPLLRSLAVVLPVGLAAGWAWSTYAAVGHGGIQNAILHPAPRIEDGSWVVAPRGVTDLLSFVAPRQLLPEPPPWALHRHTVYLGAVLLGLAVLGARRHREARLWTGLAAVLVLLALGSRLMVGGVVVSSTPLPGAVAGWLGAQHPYRFTGLAVLLLLGAAALAVQGWRPWRQALVGALLFAEGLLLAPVEPMAVIEDPAGPVEHWLSAQEGAVLDLPFDRECERLRGPFPQRAFYQLTAHHRPVASAFCALPEARGLATVRALDDWVLAAWTAGRLTGPIPSFAPPPPVRAEAPPLVLPASAEADRQALVAQGFAWVWIDRQALPVGMERTLENALTAWLGAPVQAEPRRRLFAL